MEQDPQIFTRRTLLSGSALLLMGAGCSNPAEKSELNETTFASSSTTEQPISTSSQLILPDQSFDTPAGTIPQPNQQEVKCNPLFSDTRQDLVDFLRVRNAFNVHYSTSPDDAYNDLRDPSKSTDKLIEFLFRVTRFGFCMGAEFDVLNVNTGHSRLTTNGNVSQHNVGLAVDIRPRINPAGTIEPIKTRPEDFVIVDNPDALLRAQILGSYLFKNELPNLRQLICSGLNPNWNKGKKVNYSDWDPSVLDVHWDHIHAGLNP